MSWEDTPVLEKFKLYRYAFPSLRDKKLRGARSDSTNGLVALDRGNDSRVVDAICQHLRSPVAIDDRKGASDSQAQYEEADNWDFEERRRGSATRVDHRRDPKHELGRSPDADSADADLVRAIRYSGSAVDRDNSPFQKKVRHCLREAAFQGRGPPMRASNHLMVWTFLDEWDCKAILDGETEYDEYDDGQCYVEACQSLAKECREIQSRESRRRGLQTAVFEDSSLEPRTRSADRPRKTLASKGPRKGPYERKLDDMVERAECSTRCGTPYAATCDCWDDDWDEHASAREGIQRQGVAAILYGGMEGYDNYTSWVESRRRIGSARHWERSRVNPIEEPCWWSDEWGRMLYDENREMRCGGEFLTLYDENGVSKEEVEELDWSWWAEKLTWTYDEKVTVSYSGNGSHERLRVEVNQPRDDVWRRGCPCQKPVTNYEIGIGGWNVFDGPSWLFWDMVSTWTAALLMFAYWEWVVGWDLRKKQDAARHRRERRKRVSKVKID